MSLQRAEHYSRYHRVRRTIRLRFEGVLGGAERGVELFDIVQGRKVLAGNTQPDGGIEI